MENSSVNIPVKLDDGSVIQIQFYPLTPEGTIAQLDEVEAVDYGEAPVQILEGHSYEYVITAPYHLEEVGDVVKSFASQPSGGRIRPNNYIGTLQLEIMDEREVRRGLVQLEVRSIKTSHRTDYRTMLEYITDKCTTLLMQHTSPALQHFKIDPYNQAQTSYQRFAFIYSILESPEFKAAIHRIQEDPVTHWTHEEEERDIRNVRRMNRSTVIQLLTKSRRIELPEEHRLRPAISSLPATVTTLAKRETTDTAENRFVKYVLTELQHFCASIKTHFAPASRAYREAAQSESVLANMAGHTMFKEVARPSVLALNSPILQRREGYREVLKVWLMFDLAARLAWKGGEDIYAAGKRNVAVLYEYWAFFVLLDIVCELFTIENPDIQQLIEPTNNGLELKLKLGQKLSIKGRFCGKRRAFLVRFHFNKTFSGNKPYPSGGSWTKAMRPDYTLSLWPEDISEEEAEHQELMVHIHFDAKYKVDHLAQIVNEEEQNQALGSKRSDILKMHAYRDAIRRTGGAYILYPGDEIYERKAFHEIFPGIGAFPLRPSQDGGEIQSLKKFLMQVIDHLEDEASQRIQVAYNIFKIHLPEEKSQHLTLRGAPFGTIPPAETYILVGYCKNQAHRSWIEANGSYNIRLSAGKSNTAITSDLCAAQYLLLHDENELVTGNIRRILGAGPYIFSDRDLKALGYPEPGNRFYLMFDVAKETIPELLGQSRWDIRKLPGYRGQHASSLPFVVSLKDLLKVG